MAAPKSSLERPLRRKRSAKKAVNKPARRPAAGKKKAAREKAATPHKKRPTVAAPAVSPAVADLDRRIAIVRNNLRDLTETAAASSGASNEELASGRIADQEEQLRALIKQRDDLVRGKG